MPDHAAALERLRQVADAAVPVLIGGETGTGKELLARGLHELLRLRFSTDLGAGC